MPGTMISPSEIEEYLNDQERLIILHALDGEIWGASLAATELFGYTNEEMRQMYLANIKPKNLRLSDVCKTQKLDDSLVVFERRNGRRFTASIDTRIIRTTFLRDQIDLVCLEFTIVNRSVSVSNSPPTLDVQEATAFISSLSSESRRPLSKMDSVIKKLKVEESYALQRKLIDELVSLRDEVEFINDNIIDSFQLSLNALNLDRQPFNLIDVLGTFIDPHCPAGKIMSVLVDRSVPELVYGDESKLKRVWDNLIEKVDAILRPKSYQLFVKYIDNEDVSEMASFSLRLFDCEGSIASELDNSEGYSTSNLSNPFIDSVSILICKHLVRLMGGSLRFAEETEGKVEVNFEVSLPEVHDLGLESSREFLDGKHLILVEPTDSILFKQLCNWGAQVERFHDLEMAFAYLKSFDGDIHLFITHDEEEKPQVDDQYISVLQDKNIDLLLICPAHEVIGEEVLHLSNQYAPARLGNVLSQLVDTKFPFPYSNINFRRRIEFKTEKSKVLVVNNDDHVRNLIEDVLKQEGFHVDIAVNGIDAVLACSHFQYNVILMDESLPYMDGVEAAIHLRRISDLNESTPVVIMSEDNSENARVSRKHAGVTAELIKPVKAAKILDMVRTLVKHSEEIEIEKPEQDLKLQRRAEEIERKAFGTEVALDKQVLDRLTKDTSKDVCKEMVDMFIEESLISLSEISKCCVAGDWAAILEHSHSLRSSSRTFGCEALYSLTLQLEEESRKNNMGECIRLASILPAVFLQSQQNLYDYCSLNNNN